MIRPPRIAGSAERQRDAPHGAPGPCSQDVGGVLHLRRHQLECRRGEDEDVGKGIERDDERQAGEAVDVERPRLRARHQHEEPVEPAGIGSGQQDPGDGAGVGRRDEGHQHQHAGEAASRHVGARHRPGERNGEQAGQCRRCGAELERIHERIDVARPAVGGGVVGEGEIAGLLGGEARDHQVDERAHHQEQQDRDDRDPDEPRRIEGKGAPRRVRCRETPVRRQSLRWVLPLQRRVMALDREPLARISKVRRRARSGRPSTMCRESTLPQFPNVSRHCSITSGMPLSISATVGRMVLISLIGLAPGGDGTSGLSGMAKCLALIFAASTE